MSSIQIYARQFRIPKGEFASNIFFLPFRLAWRRQEDNSVNRTLPEGLTLLRRRRESESEGYHIVYRRAVPAVETDYGESPYRIW